MPYDPTKPVNGSLISSAELRNQFTGLKDLIDAVTPPPAETDPVFTASEAALLVPGDKAKLDAALSQPNPVALDLPNRRLIANDGSTDVADWSDPAGLQVSNFKGLIVFLDGIRVGQPGYGGGRLFADGANWHFMDADFLYLYPTSYGGGPGAGGAVSVGGEGALFDALVQKAVDWQNRQLVAEDGATPQLDWKNGVLMPNLPTSDPAVAGQLWNDAGTLKVSAG